MCVQPLSRALCASTAGPRSAEPATRLTSGFCPASAAEFTSHPYVELFGAPRSHRPPRWPRSRAVHHTRRFLAYVSAMVRDAHGRRLVKRLAVRVERQPVHRLIACAARPMLWFQTSWSMSPASSSVSSSNRDQQAGTRTRTGKRAAAIGTASSGPTTRPTSRSRRRK